MRQVVRDMSESGTKIGVLLIHGLCGSPTEFRYISNGLSRDGYVVDAPALPSYTGRDDSVLSATWEDWYRSTEEALNRLSEQCDQVIVGGLSTGAVLGLILAARNPDKVHGLALYSPTLWLSGRSIPWYLKACRFITSKRFANLFRFPFPAHVGIKDDRVRKFVRAAALANGGDEAPSTPGCIVVERRRLCKAAVDVLNQVEQPVLILHSREDDYAGLDNAFRLQRDLTGQVDLIVLEDCYHMITVDRQRSVVLDRTQSFVARFAGTVADAVRGHAAAQPGKVATGGLHPSAA